MLRANVNYLVKVRAYTKENIAMETEWVSVHGEAGEDDGDAKGHPELYSTSI